MPNKKDRLFGILEELADIKKGRSAIIDQFDDVVPDDYPSAKRSEYKWYERFRKNPRENLEQFMKDRPRKALENFDTATKSFDLLYDDKAPLDKKINAALNLWTFKAHKTGFWTDPEDPDPTR